MPQPRNQDGPSRRLAAILFADIVGYTAMMQSEEVHALKVLKRFQKVLAEAVDSHRGEVIKSYGDGSLVLFNSTIEAMQCACEIQQAFQEEPRVPLRIGVHVGEVIKEEGDYFGNGINIASRIESMGIAGAVLFSRNVAEKIKNHPEFDQTSLGHFYFKNVEEPVEVFAMTNKGLTVPAPNEIRGKGIPVKPSRRLPAFSWITWLIVFGLLIGVLAAPGFWKNLSEGQELDLAAAEPTITILPFRDLSPQKDQEYFCDGVAEEILNALSRLKGLTVRGRASSFSLKGRNLTTQEIGEALNATVLLEGSIRRTADKIRINVQLLDVEQDAPLWTNQYDRESGDIFAVQEDIARQVINKLQITLLPGEEETLLAEQTDNPLAHESYLKGMKAVSQGARMVDETLQYFHQAIELDPAYYAAYIQLSFGYFLREIYLGEAGSVQQSWDLAEKAVQLNSGLPDAYIRLAELSLNFRRDWTACHRYYQQALDRGYREPNEFHPWISILNQEYEQAVREAEALLENDPFSINKWVNLSRFSLFARKFEKTLEITDQLLKKFPGQSSAMRHRGEAYLALGQPEKALPIFEKLVKINGYAAYGYVISLHQLGREKEAYEAFQQYRQNFSFPNTYMAYCYTEFEKPDSAFVLLNRAIDEQEIFIWSLRSYSLLDSLHQDPRYDQLVRRLELPQ